MADKKLISRRDTLKGIGALGAGALGNAAFAGGEDYCKPKNAKVSPNDAKAAIRKKVFETPLVDTHEHLVPEKDRTGSDDDWTRVLSMYFKHDMITCGMPEEKVNKFFGGGLSASEKWKIIAPYWPAVRNTGYGQSIRVSFKELYGVEDLNEQTVEKVAAGYKELKRPGYYKTVLKDMCNITSCQVQSLDVPYRESAQPELLMQDLGIVFLYAAWNPDKYSKPTGIKPTDLASWHKVIDWYFDKYGKYAVACKSQDAYGRNIGYDKDPAEVAAPIFARRMAGESISREEENHLKNHLFWKCVERAVEYDLPIKLHTGYYAGHDNMPLSTVSQNAAGACEICRDGQEAKFVFIHMGWPYYEEMIAVAKHYTNAYVDLAWAWILNPVSTKECLKKFIVSAPSNKIFVFGGDCGDVEQVVGHAKMAREGVASALYELVDDGWLSVDDAIGLVDMLMYKNAEKLYNLDKKRAALKNVPWQTS